MVKGVSIRFNSYEATIPRLLEVIKFHEEIKKHEKVILKPNLIKGDKDKSTKIEFMEPIIKYIQENKNPGTEVLIAEGCDGKDTMDVFDDLGYRKLAENYDIGLIDLNESETELVQNDEFLRFEEINYPKILRDNLVISLPTLQNSEDHLEGALHNMIGAFPGQYYAGFFSLAKKKIHKYPVKYQIHDILKCKMPEFAICDASHKGHILAGQPIEIDKQGARLLGHEPSKMPFIKLINESFSAKNN